ncbi:MAG: GNAT family N-acetyltransferase [Burkholderiales bacterium]|nr:GNAT family N-acetyltransferase [Burkholderiales bacterium]MDE1928127.1 GNAT family N-acetyltransferase [Burkholderiales bacterium]MDE2159539.1 GNAT family N-acetyltransferase [Burkholderiales bacterium]MDE2503457.1 GNAT family N-acetyltransferase [Burkholderiales bacterium]
MIHITPASIDDAPTLLEIQRRAFAEEGRRVGRLEDGREIPPLAEPLAAIVEHIEHQTALVARDGARIVGAVRGVVTDGVCVIRALVVDTDRQGRGIGSALLRALEERLAGVDRFDLTTNMITTGNVPFYERQGYRLLEVTRYAGTIRLAQMSKPGSR